MSISEQGRVMATGDAARDGELDLGAVGRALVRKKWWVLGPALLVAALTFVGVNLVTPKYKSEARILIDGGYRIERVTPVDQFRHTPHVELVARFVRGR